MVRARCAFTLLLLALCTRLLAGCNARLDSFIEDPLDVIQRVLVHGVDAGKRGNHKVHHAASRRHSSVLFSLFLDHFLDLLRLLEAFRYFLAFDFGGLERFDQFDVVKNGLLGTLSERSQDGRLHFELLVFAGRNVDHKLVPLLLHLRFQILDGVREELLVESVKSDSEIDDGQFDGDFGHEMRVG